MAQMYISELHKDVLMLSAYYMKDIIDIKVEDVCNHSINRGLSKQFTIEIISYFYGIHKDIAINSVDPIIRQNCFIGMGDFYNALNLLDNDYNIQLYSLSNRYTETQSKDQSIECIYTLESIGIVIPSPYLKQNIQPTEFEFDKMIPGVHSISFNNDIESNNDIQYCDYEFCY